MVNKPDKLIACLFLGLCCPSALSKSPSVDDAEDVMQRLRSRVAAHLNEMRNYTCRVVIDRSEVSMPNGAIGGRDRVELNVAFVNDRELFEKPGEIHFDEHRIRDLVPAGMIGDDALGTHDDASFLGNLSTVIYAGVHKKEGHEAVQLDFRIPMEESRLYVKGRLEGAMVGYKGHLWVDAETLEMVRLEWKTEHIPSSVGILSVTKAMHYKLVHIGSRDVSLPVGTELTSVDQVGIVRVNVIHLDRCQAFAAESVVNYGSPVDGTARQSGVRPPQ